MPDSKSFQVGYPSMCWVGEKGGQVEPRDGLVGSGVSDLPLTAATCEISAAITSYRSAVTSASFPLPLSAQGSVL